MKLPRSRTEKPKSVRNTVQLKTLLKGNFGHLFASSGATVVPIAPKIGGIPYNSALKKFVKFLNMIFDNRTIRDKFISCYHEAGHATVALAIGIRVDSINIHKTSDAWGETRFNRDDVYAAPVIDLVTFSVGGVVAERRRYFDPDIPLSGTDKSGIEKLLKIYSKNDQDKMMSRAYERAELALEKNEGVYLSLKKVLYSRFEADIYDIRRALKYNTLTRIP